MGSIVSMQEQHHHIPQDAVVNRVDQAFARLQMAWRNLRAQRAANATRQFDAASMIELDAAEEEWLAARAAAVSRGPDCSQPL